MTIDPRSDLISTLVSRFVEARVCGKPASLSDLPNIALTTDEAYQIQAEVARQIGPIGGFKVANKPASRIMAPIFAKDMYRSPATLSVSPDEEIGIELEIGFRIDAALPSLDTPDRKSIVAQRLSAVAVIEIVRTRMQGDASPELKLADNQINGGLVVGEPIKEWSRGAVGEVDARLRLGDRGVVDGRVTVPGGDAFENFLVLEAMIGAHCGGLKPGQIVITGSLNGLPYVRGALDVRGEITGFGGVSIDLRVDQR